MFAGESFAGESFHPTSWAGIGVAEPPIEPPISSGGGYSRRIKPAAPVVIRIRGAHRGVNWSIGQLRATVDIAGYSSGRSVAIASDPLVRVQLAACASGRAFASANLVTDSDDDLLIMLLALD